MTRLNFIPRNSKIQELHGGCRECVLIMIVGQVKHLSSVNKFPEVNIIFFLTFPTNRYIIQVSEYIRLVYNALKSGSTFHYIKLNLTKLV